MDRGRHAVAALATVWLILTVTNACMTASRRGEGRGRAAAAVERDQLGRAEEKLAQMARDLIIRRQSMERRRGVVGDEERDRVPLEVLILNEYG